MTISTQPQADAAERALKAFYKARIRLIIRRSKLSPELLSPELGMSIRWLRKALERDTEVVGLRKIVKKLADSKYI